VKPGLIMKRTFLIFLFIGFVFFLNAQKIYFVYLQTETSEPFFVRMDDKLYSSSPTGYLILSKLKDSTYKFKIGFPSKDIDLNFATSINKKDHGFLIKNLGEKGWGLFDLQTLELQTTTTNAKKETGLNSTINYPVNAFTEMLSKATDDPSLKQSPVFVNDEEKKSKVMQTVDKAAQKPAITDAVVKEEKKIEPASQPISKLEESKAEVLNTSSQKENFERNNSLNQQIYKRSEVTKISEVNSGDGFESVFIDQNQDGTKDTIRILIRADKELTIIQEPKKEEAKVDSTKILNVTGNATQATNKPVADAKKDDSKKWWPFNKSKTEAEAKKCESVAGNDDFLKLRRKMAGRTNDDGMIDEAKKYFKATCFSTEQIKNLSSMFLSNAGKYNFFVAAHDYTTDVENFPSLQSELKDEMYINRFKELLHN
jgi:hypothetical protein